MVDPEPGYRPRRAIVDPAAAGDEPASTPTGPASPDAPRETVPPSPGGASALPTGGTDDDQPKPLYRDEVGPTPVRGAAAGDAPAAGGPAAPVGEEARVTRPLNFRQRQRRATEDDADATTLLPRTATGARKPAAGAEDLDLDDEHGRRLLGRRGRLALLVGAMAAVIAVGIALIYAVSSVGDPTATPTTGTQPTAASASGSGTPATDPSTLLTDLQLLTPAGAAPIAGDRSWTVALTQRPPAADAPLPACLTDEPAEGEPTAQQEVVRQLDSDGKNPPSALHQAQAYPSPQDAAQAYAVAAKSFGSCAVAGSTIVSGSAITGLGDQSAGLVVETVSSGKVQRHSVVLTRTGSVLNTIDAAQADRALPLAGVAKAMASVVTTQCQPAGGACDAEPVAKDAPPPLGGDVPGFLATGDLPPAGKGDESWLAAPAEPPSETFLGSQCETVTWSRVSAEAASTRVYLVPSSTEFGLNEIVLTLADDKAASQFAAKIKSDLDSCAKRKLTATVSTPEKVTGAGAEGSTVTGWTASVAQKSTDGTQRYRVGVVSSGSKVAYTFLNPLAGGYDLTDAEWDRVAVRAGQRMTQVP